MDTPELPKVPEGAKKFLPYIAVGGVALVLVLANRGKGSAVSSAPGTNNGPAMPSNPFAAPQQSGSPAAGSPVGSPVQQVQDNGLGNQLAFFDAFYLPLGSSKPATGATAAANVGIASAGNPGGTTGKSRFDYFNQSVLAQKQGQVAVQGEENRLQRQNEIDAQKAQADIAQKQKDRDSNLFRNPSNFLKGVGDVGGSLSKVFGIKW